jgi:NADH-quinone oxidoreductase subunit N
MNSLQDLILSLPITILMVTGLLLMLVDAFRKYELLPWIAGGGILTAVIMALPPVYLALLSAGGITEMQSTAFSGMLRTENLDWVIFIILSSSAFFTLFFLGDFLKRMEKPIYDMYALLVFALLGMVMLANGNDLIITFIGLETMSICLYVMAAAFKQETKSNEAGLKYFLLGAFASAFFLYGIALIYGAAGTTNFSVMAGGSSGISTGLFYPGIAMLLVGFLFKVSAFPFHAWTPDVYTGTPTPLAGFMATGSKAAAFIAFAYLMNASGAIHDEKIQWVLSILALCTMIYGNVVAVQQTNLKRMLAYSSIAHSGYLLLAILAGPVWGYPALIFYVFIYTLMNVGAFGMVSMAESNDQDQDIENWKGMGMANPWFGAGLSIFLFSLAGVPPLAGFFSKYFVFISAIHADLVVLSILGILTSVIGAYYYIRIVVSMFFLKGDKPVATVTSHLAPIVGVVLLAALVVALGAYPGLMQGNIQTAFDHPILQSASAMVNP